MCTEYSIRVLFVSNSGTDSLLVFGQAVRPHQTEIVNVEPSFNETSNRFSIGMESSTDLNGQRLLLVTFHLSSSTTPSLNQRGFRKQGGVS